MFPIGSHVLLEQDSVSKSNLLAPKRSGPFKVISQDGDQVILQDLNNPSRTLPSHVSRCTPYISRAEEDLQQEALRGSDLFIVEEIVSHKIRSRPNRRKLQPFDIILTVKWRGYSELSDEPLSNITVRNSAAFVRYAQKIDQLKPFIKTILDPDLHHTSM